MTKSLQLKKFISIKAATVYSKKVEDTRMNHSLI